MAFPTAQELPRFNDPDYDARHSQFWLMPVRWAEDGTLAALWRPAGTTKGGGAAGAILPLLALVTDAPPPGQEWSGVQYCQSRERLGVLSGLDADTVSVGMRHLRDMGLLRYSTHPGSKKQHVTKYQLSARVWAREGEPYATFPAILVYGGMWSLLPTPASRQLYLAMLALDPVLDEESWIATACGFAGDGAAELAATLRREGYGALASHPGSAAVERPERIAGDPEAAYRYAQRLLADRRSGEPVSWNRLRTVCGIGSNSTIKTALAVLTTPIYPVELRSPAEGARLYPGEPDPAPADSTLPLKRVLLPLVESGDSRHSQQRWHAPSRRFFYRAWDRKRRFFAHYLNACPLATKRAELWPFLAAPPAEEMEKAA